MIQNRSVGTAVNSAGATTLGPVVPATAKEGDLLVLVVAVLTGTAQTFTGLTGWTQRYNLNNGTAPTLAVFTKTCVSADIGATLAPAWTTSAACVAFVVSYSGVDLDNPIDNSTSASGGGSTVDPGALTTPLNCVMVAITAQNQSTAIAAPSGWTTRRTAAIASTINVALSDSDSPELDGGVAHTATMGITFPAGTNWESVKFTLRGAQTPRARSFGLGTVLTATGSNTSPSITLSNSEVKDNDVGILTLAYNNNTSTITAVPSGWTLIRQDQMAGLTLATYRRVMAATDDGTAQGFTLSATAAWTIEYVSVSGVDDSSIVDVSNGTAAATQTALNAPSVTTTQDDDLLLTVVARIGGGTLTIPPGMEPGSNTESGTTAKVSTYWETFAKAAATGQRGPTLSTAATAYAAQNIAIKAPTGRVKIRSVSYDNTSDATTSSNETLVQLPPSVIVDGDTMLAFVWCRNVLAATVTPPAGWTLVDAGYTAAVPTLRVYKKTAASESGNYSFATTDSNPIGIIVCFVGKCSVDVDGYGHTNSVPASFVIGPITPGGTTPKTVLLAYAGNVATTFTGDAAVEVLDKTLGSGNNATEGVGYEFHRPASSISSRVPGTHNSAAHTGVLLAVRNDPPSQPGAFTAPLTGEVVPAGPGYVIGWGASTDPDGDTVTYTLEGSNDGGSTWTVGSVPGISTNSFTWDTTGLAGNNFMLRVWATTPDGKSSVIRQSGVFTIGGVKPRVIVGT